MEHVHIGLLPSIITVAGTIAIIGTLNLVAQKYKTRSTLAATWLEVISPTH